MAESTLRQVRGDTKGYKFQRKNDDGSVITMEPDKLYFTVKQDWNKANALIQKTKEDMTMDQDGTWHFRIESIDTAELKYGQYVYDIEVITDGVVTTIAKGDFEIEEEATFVSNEV